MSRSESEFGGSFSVDGSNVEVDLAEFGWPGDRPAATDTDDVESDVETTHDDDGRIRLQKALAHAGIASRRACEALITSGRVTVNGEPERELGSRIDPSTDEVRVDGVVVQLDATKRYFVLNKPLGVVSTMSDENGRPDLREFTQKIEDRLYNVGRLDTDTSGLLILTNDGDLAHKLAHPSFGVQKTYIAKVRGRVTASVIQQLKDGIELSDGPIRADWAKILPGGSGKTHSLVELTIHSGRNRIVRRMLAEVGHPVVELVRRKFGPLRLGTLPMGELRELGAAERGALLSATSFEEGGEENGGERGARRPITSGRPGDGKGAQGMRGIAAKGNPHGRRSAEYQGDDRFDGPRSAGSRSGAPRSGGRDERRGGVDRDECRGGYGRDERPSRERRSDERRSDERRSDEGRGGRGDATAGGRYARSNDLRSRGGRDAGRDGGFDRSRGGRDAGREGGFDRSRGSRDGGYDRSGGSRDGGRDGGFDRSRGSRDGGREGGFDRSRGGRDGGFDRSGGSRDGGREGGFDRSRGGRDGGSSYGGRDTGARGFREGGRDGGRDGGYRGGRDGDARSGGTRSGGARDSGFRGTRDGGFDRSRDNRSGGSRDGGSRDGGSRDGGFRGGRDDNSRGSRDGGYDRGRPSDSRGGRDSGRDGGFGRSRDERGDARGGFRGNRDGGADRSRGERGDARGGRDFGGARGSRDSGSRDSGSRGEGSRDSGSRGDRGPRGGGRDGGSRGPRDGQQRRDEW